MAPRHDVINKLAKQALHAMDDPSIEGLTASEVVSACFTLTRQVVEVLLDEDDPANRAHNIDQVQTAIAEIYRMVTPKQVN